MNRHLVLGGTGFVGRHVAAELSRRGKDVIVAGRRTSASSSLIDAMSIGSRVTYRELDLLTADWEHVLRDVDVVHHYAWSSIPQTANDNALGDFDLHVRGSLNLMDAMRRVGGRKRIVFLSSGGTVYGPSSAPLLEDHALCPIGAYGAAKAAVELYLRAFHHSGWLDARVARLSNPYGPGQDPARNQGVVGVFARLAVNGRPLEIWGDGEIVRDYIYITDAAVGLAELALAELAGAGGMHVFNIASGIGVTLNELLDSLGRAVKGQLTVRRCPGRPYDVPVSILDVDKAHRLLAWCPRVSLAAGVQATVLASMDDTVLLAHEYRSKLSGGVDGAD